MWLFGNRAKLLRRLDHLSFYNDKNIYYLKHTPAQAEAERASEMALIKSLMLTIGKESFPDSFLSAVESGALATDATGQFLLQLKAHFRHRNAP